MGFDNYQVRVKGRNLILETKGRLCLAPVSRVLKIISCLGKLPFMNKSFSG